MSGVNLKRLRDGTSGVSLKASVDIERQLESTAMSPAPTGAVAAASPVLHGDVGVNNDGIPLTAGAASASFSYLFSSPAERRAEREAREKAEKERRQAEKHARMAQSDPRSVMSKHQRALHDAQQRGLQLEGMNRKARREFLRLTVSAAQQRAEAQSREFKLHDLMDDKLAWYQQGPHPVDLIAEKLVRRKAEKKAKQLGLKYNYLAPHASWLAKRAQRRRESLLVGLGKRLVFNDDDDDDDASGAGGAMTVTDPLHHLTVPLRDMGLLMVPAAVTNSAADASDEDDDEATAEAVLAAAMQADNDSEDGRGANLSEGDGIADVNTKEEDNAAQGVTRESAQGGGAQISSSTPPADDAAGGGGGGIGSGAKLVGLARLPDVGVLQDPSRLASSVVRRVVRDRATALAIQQLNRTTTFLSSGLVKGPSLMPEDTAAAAGLPTQTQFGGSASVRPTSLSSSSATTRPPKRPTRASAAPSFSPYAAEPFSTAAPVEEKEGELVVSAPAPTSQKPQKRVPRRASVDEPVTGTADLKAEKLAVKSVLRSIKKTVKKEAQKE
jgi:hypothetical protein